MRKTIAMLSLVALLAPVSIAAAGGADWVALQEARRAQQIQQEAYKAKFKAAEAEASKAMQAGVHAQPRAPLKASASVEVN